MNRFALCIYLTLCVVGTQSFLSPLSPQWNELRTRSDSLILVRGDGTGGWGIGNSREISPEEYAKGDRRAFEGYQLSDRSDFMKQVEKDTRSMKEDELAELLGVANIAGINVKDPSTRLNKFGKEILKDDENDDLDLSI